MGKGGIEARPQAVRARVARRRLSGVKVFAIYNIKGGVGKTTTAVNLAWISAREGARTLIWDLDPQGAATFTFRVKPKVVGGGREVLHEAAALHGSIKGTDYERLDLLPADFSYRDLDRILDRERESDRCLAHALAPLADEYDHVFLDCPASISLLSENVFTAAGWLLVPTIPTVLSLRTLARLVKHLKTRSGPRPRVLPFFSMVDRRKRLHRDVCNYAVGNELGFLASEIPYSSVIEQMGVRRSPVGAYSAGSPPSRACTELWREIASAIAVGEGLAKPSGKSVKALLAAAERSSPTHARGTATASGVSRVAARWKAMMEDSSEGPREVEFKVRVRSEDDFDALARLATGSAGGSERTVIQENHFFDTADGALREAGYALRLRIEEKRRLLTAKGPSSRAEDGLTERPEEEVLVEPAEAERILSGAVSPLAVLVARTGSHSRLLELVGSWAGRRPLVHVGSFKNVRRYVGPVELGDGMSRTEVMLEMDRTEFPDGSVDHEIEVEVDSKAAEPCRAGLSDLLDRAGIPWETAPSKAERFFAALGRRAARPV